MAVDDGTGEFLTADAALFGRPSPVPRSAALRSRRSAPDASCNLNFISDTLAIVTRTIINAIIYITGNS